MILLIGVYLEQLESLYFMLKNYVGRPLLVIKGPNGVNYAGISRI